jgi:Spy/CpxP family protein refolding chaperone
MNTLAKLTLTAAAAIGTMLGAQAPNGTTNPAPVQTHQPASPQQQLDRLTKKLALTPDQQNQILPILTDRQQQMDSIKNDASMTPKQRHAQMKTARNESEAKLRSVLTDTQRTALDQMQQDARDRAKARKQSTVSN